MWESYLRDETPVRGAPHLVHVIEHELKDGDLALALDHWRELVHHGGQIGPPPLAFRLASALQESSPADAAEVFLRIADDPAAGLLAAKAAHRLEALATTPEDRAYWHKRAGDTTPGPAAAAAAAAVPPPAAVATTSARPPASGQAGQAPAVPVTTPEPAPAAPAATPFVVEACYLESMDSDGILLRAGGGAAEFLPFGRIAAVAVGGITGAAKPYLVIDLVLHPSAGVHSVLRLLSSQLDPRMLTGRGDLPPIDAFRELVRRIAVAASAPMLPGGKTSGAPTLSTFRSLEEYEARVLLVALGG
jgi:hypothetical protein